jgi:hypothetical protein
MGLAEPDSLAGWVDVDLGSTNLPWLKGKQYETLQRSISYFLLDNQINKSRRKSESRAVQSLLKLMRKPLHWRLRHSAFEYPFELWLSMVRQWLTVRRSLLTGQALSQELAKAR